MAIIFAKLQGISLVRGTAWSDDLQLIDQPTGEPVNLAGIEGLVMRVRRSINGPILMELSLANGRLVVIDEAQGRIGIRVDSATTLALPEYGNKKAKYLYDAVIERFAGEYEPAVSGKLSVLPSITRPWANT